MNTKIMLSILSGILFGISWHSFGFPLFIFFAFIPLFIIDQELIIKNEKITIIKIFIYSYLSFLIWNLIVIHWLGFSKHLDGSYAIEALLLPLIINSFLMSIIFSICHYIKKKTKSYVGLLFFICIWISFEKLHLHWIFTFPWLNLGNVFAKHHQWIQWYEYTGTFGGSLWILLINVFIFFQYRSYQIKKKNSDLKKIIYYLPFFIGLPIVISYVRYYTFEEKGSKIQSVIIQPELDPYREQYNVSSNQIIKTLLKLSDKKITNKTNFIVAPETVFPDQEPIKINNIEKNYYIKLIKNYLKSKNNSCVFIAGINTYSTYSKKPYDKESIFWNPYSNSYEEHFNSAIQITYQDSISIYHKSKLVIGVERMPFYKKINQILKNLLNEFQGGLFSLGTQKERSVFRNKFNKAIIAPIICYESIYGEYVGEYVKKGANILFIMTNDSWWGNSQGHKQLLMLSKLRAIETRKNIVRSANSGISCSINSKGDINHSMNYLKKGSMKVETLINNYKTLYVVYGDYLANICIILLGIIIIYLILELCLEKK